MDLPWFNGSSKIEEFLDWLSKVDRFFEYMDIKERKKVKLVALRLDGCVSAWWDQCQLNRAEDRKKPVRSWAKMKKLLCARFLSSNYGRQLFTQYQNCKQGTWSIAEYTQDYHRLASCNNLKESQDQRIAWFIEELKQPIQDKLIINLTLSLEEKINRTEEIKRLTVRAVEIFFYNKRITCRGVF